MYFLILQALLFGITYARNCAISTDKCPEGEIKWKQRAEEFNCTSKYGRYTCMKDSKNRLVETCVDNIVIKRGVVGCPYIVICKDINTALIGLDEDFKECPTNKSGCPPQQHSGYSLHELYKYPECSGNSDSLMSGNEDTSTKLPDKISWTAVVFPIVSILAVLFVVLGILLYLRRTNRLSKCCVHTTESDDLELGTSQRFLGDHDAETGKEEDKELWEDKMQTKIRTYGEEMKELLESRNSERIIEKIDKWKKECVHIGLAGLSMAGKSSFINVMLGESTKQKAKIGQGNVTIYPTLYNNPKYKGLKFWDFPGYGTPEFPLNEKYLKAHKFEECDLILVFYSSVLQETDLKFINHLLTLEKKFAIVKTRADDLISSAMKHHPFDDLVGDAKRKCLTTLADQGIHDDVQVFFISNITPSLGEFDDLINFLTKNIDETKRMHIFITLQRQTRGMIDEKIIQLKDRAWRTAIAMGVNTALPLPGIDIAFNMALLIKEIKSYLEVFHLDARSLKQYPKHHVKKLKTCHKVLTAKFIKCNLAKFAAMSTAGNIFEVALPILGGFANGAYSTYCMYNFLKTVITDLANDARLLMQLQTDSLV